MSKHVWFPYIFVSKFSNIFMSAKETLLLWLGDGHIKLVLEGMYEVCRRYGSKDEANDNALQKGRYVGLMQQHHSGTISQSDYTVELAKIRSALQYLIERYPDHWRVDVIAHLKPPQNTPTANLEQNNSTSNSFKRKLLWIAGAITFLASVAEFSGYSLRDIFTGYNAPVEAESITVTVFVHGKAGADDRILKNQGKVYLQIGSDEKECTINDKGEATFKEIPAGYKGKEARIRVDHPQPYRVLHPDSLYILQDKASIYVEIALEGTDKIRGKVMDFKTEQLLDSVRVSIDNVATYTDKHGYYELEIPENRQRKFQRVTFSKHGYRSQELDSIPVHTQQEIQIALKKR